MIDFNEIPEPVERHLDAEREEIRAALLASLESALFTLFPAGRKRRGTRPIRSRWLRAHAANDPTLVAEGKTVRPRPA